MRADLLDILTLRGPTPARDLLAALAVSQPTLSRLVSAAGDRVLRIGRARASRYAASRVVPGEGDSWRVYRVDQDGRVAEVAVLHALAPKGWWLECSTAKPPWLRGEFADGLFPGFPWVLAGLRPEGFLGRAFGHRHGHALGIAGDPTRWSDDDALRAMLRLGEDLPGDLILGDLALQRFLENSRDSGAGAIPARGRVPRLDELAEAAMAGEIVGSSAGGEQPKFGVRVAFDDGVRHLLVKFSPPRTSPPGQRWADLLVCEHLAAVTLQEHGIAACDSRLEESPSRTYLEVERFDRVGDRGRRGIVSLLHLDAAHYGMLDDWGLAARRYQRDGWMNAEDAETLRLLRWFGTFIGNTDMHFANASLLFADDLPLRLAPCYDMLPMHFRPASSGEVTTRPLGFPVPLPGEADVAGRAAAIARVFWGRVTQDARISPAFREIAARAERTLLETVVRS